MQALVRGAGDAMLRKLLYEVNVMRANGALPEKKQITITVTRSYLGEECRRRFVETS
jgi:hypothetical protein